MIVNLHIERLVLDGMPIGSHEAPLVQAAVEVELARLLADVAPDRLADNRFDPLVRSEAIVRVATGGDGLGAQIGQAIFAGIDP